MKTKDKIITCGLCHSHFHYSEEHTDSRMFKEIELINKALSEKGLIKIEDVEKMIEIIFNKSFYEHGDESLTKLKFKLNKLKEIKQ